MMVPGDGLRVIRVSWSLLGGAWGAWTGFEGYLRLSHSADSFGAMLALAFFVAFAVVGLVAGGIAGALVGAMVNAFLRRLGVDEVAAVLVATVVNALVIWQTVVLTQQQFPALRAPDQARGKSSVSVDAGPGQKGICQESPPVQAKERALWDSECR